MSESKQDIQAKVDQLDERWAQNLDEYKVKRWGSLVVPVAGVGWKISMALLLVALPLLFAALVFEIVELAAYWNERGDVVLLLIDLFCALSAIFGFIVTARERKKRLSVTAVYEGALRSYQEERSRLRSLLSDA